MYTLYIKERWSTSQAQTKHTEIKESYLLTLRQEKDWIRTKRRSPSKKEWNEYINNQRNKNKTTAFHDTHLTSSGEDGLAIAAWIAFNNATKLKRLSSENHLSFHVEEAEADLFPVSVASSSSTFTFCEAQNSDVSCSRERVRHQISRVSMTWKRRPISLLPGFTGRRPSTFNGQISTTYTWGREDIQHKKSRINCLSLSNKNQNYKIQETIIRPLLTSARADNLSRWSFHLYSETC